jgi:hypothetical protein
LLLLVIHVQIHAFSPNNKSTRGCSPKYNQSTHGGFEIPRFRFTGTGDIHVPVPINRGTTCNLRNPRYFGVNKPIREWQLSLLNKTPVLVCLLRVDHGLPRGNG